jgi:hypothetical protein
VAAARFSSPPKLPWFPCAETRDKESESEKARMESFLDMMMMIVSRVFREGRVLMMSMVCLLNEERG